MLCQLETLLCDEGVRSANGDCSSLPLVLSLLSLANCSHSLTARLVTDLIYPKLVHSSDDHYQLLQSVLHGVNEMRTNWLSVLGSCFSGHLQTFLEKTLLTFILTFIDKCMGTVAVPSNTRLFHKCFTATQDFILQWPSHPDYRVLLKSIRDQFNLPVYFKLETHKFSKMIDSEVTPEAFKINMSSETEDGSFCAVSSTIIRSVDTIWSDGVFLHALIDKLWDFTLRILLKHLTWARAIVQEVGVDTSLFGQCLTRFGTLVESECSAADEHIVKIMTGLLNKVLDSVDATGSSLSRFKRVGTKQDGITDDDKIKTQVQNECLAKNGRVSLADISTSLNIDLNHVERIARQLISSDSTFKLFNGELFAATYMNTLQSELHSLLKEKGCVSLSSLCVQWDLSQDILHSLFLDQLPCDFDGILDSDISGHLTCSRTSPSCCYVPHMHDCLVQACVQHMLYQNDYIRLFDGKSVSHHLFANGQTDNLQTLPSILLVDTLFEQCISTIEGELIAKGFCKVRECLHFLAIPFEDADLNAICDYLTTKDQVDIIVSNSYVFSSEMLSQVIGNLTEHIEIMAKHEVDRMEREKKIGSQQKKQDCLKEWLEEEHFVPEEIITQQSVTAQSQKRSLALLEKRACALYHSLCAFETTLKLFPEWSIIDPLSSDLRQFLLCTVGNELTNAVLSFASLTENTAQMKEKVVQSFKEREETITALPNNVRFAVTSLFNALKASDMDAFHSAVFDVSQASLHIIKYKALYISKVITEYIEELREQLSSQMEPPAILLSSVLLLHSKAGRPITASGKFVAQLITHLKDSVQQCEDYCFDKDIGLDVLLFNIDTFELLKECQNAVVHCLKNKSDDVSRMMLLANIEKLKSIVLAD
uniref:E3 UFM1-protein ligase 1 homolog n=1 Tax=Heterorhabditis bacteriophora TaxID=37862 RepID=A0A1I7XRF7_HETBA